MNVNGLHCYFAHSSQQSKHDIYDRNRLVYSMNLYHGAHTKIVSKHKTRNWVGLKKKEKSVTCEYDVFTNTMFNN